MNPGLATQARVHDRPRIQFLGAEPVTYFDDDERPALALWRERLDSYLDGQEGIEALRSRVQPNPRWPEADNRTLG